MFLMRLNKQKEVLQHKIKIKNSFQSLSDEKFFKLYLL